MTPIEIKNDYATFRRSIVAYGHGTVSYNLQIYKEFENWSILIGLSRLNGLNYRVSMGIFLLGLSRVESICVPSSQ